MGGNPAVYIRSDGRNIIVFRDNIGHIREIASDFGTSQPWISSDLFSASGEFVAPLSDPWGYKRSDNVNSVLYTDSSAGVTRLRELTLTIGSSCGGLPWCKHVMPAGATVVIGPVVRPFGYVRWDNKSAVLYVSSEGGTRRLRELSLSGGTWSDGVLPLPAGVNIDSAPFAHRAPGNRSSVLVSALDDQIDNGSTFGWVFSLPLGGSWQERNF